MRNKADSRQAQEAKKIKAGRYLYRGFILRRSLKGGYWDWIAEKTHLRRDTKKDLVIAVDLWLKRSRTAQENF